MQIANPIYDSVFKYLLEDNALAKLLIGTIIQEEILQLDFRPQERTRKLDTGGASFLTVYRLDFAARLRNAQGDERQVLIELQKAKYPSDILRFRRYLGEQYRDPDNTRLIEINQGKDCDDSKHEKKTVRRGIPLLTIYFLGHRLEHTQAAVIQIRREIVDLATGQPLTEKEPFIEGLTHDSYVIQIPELNRRHRTDIEAMLQIFDQSRRSSDEHVLDIDEQDLPERYRPLSRRLHHARAEPELAEAMDMEDEILEALRENERYVEKLQQRVEKERVEKEQERAEKERLLALLKQAGIDPEC
jgi:hypothetical protein